MLPPTRITVGKNLGLHVSWFVYRGPGTVTFDPPQVKAWEDTRAGANSPWAPLWSAPQSAGGRQGSRSGALSTRRGPTCSAASPTTGR